jgi:hypothetical protein
MCDINEEKRKPNTTGRMYEVVAYKDGAIVGSGYVIVDERGAHEPVLHDIIGNMLEPGMFEIRISEDMPRFVVVNWSKH